MIISVDAEKSLDKVQHPFMRKTLSTMGAQGAYLNIIKAIHEKTIANIILNGQKLKAFLRRSGTRQGCPLLFNVVSEVLATVIRQRKKRRKGGSKTSLFADEIIIYTENPIDSTKKLLNLISEFGKMGGFKVNIQNQRHFCTPTMKYQKQKLGGKSNLL